MAEGHRGQGLGRLLVSASLHEMARRGCRRALLDVHSDNHVAVLLYASMGFRACYTIMGTLSKELLA